MNDPSQRLRQEAAAGSGAGGGDGHCGGSLWVAGGPGRRAGVGMRGGAGAGTQAGSQPSPRAALAAAVIVPVNVAGGIARHCHRLGRRLGRSRRWRVRLGNRKAIVSFTGRVTNASRLFLRLRLCDPFPLPPCMFPRLCFSQPCAMEQRADQRFSAQMGRYQRDRSVTSNLILGR